MTPNHALHQTAAKRFRFDAPDFSDAGFAASARFRWRSVSLGRSAHKSATIEASEKSERKNTMKCPCCGSSMHEENREEREETKYAMSLGDLVSIISLIITIFWKCPECGHSESETRERGR